MDSIERKKLKEDAINYHDMLVALPPELREIIIQKLDLVDYHRLSAVSKSWRSIAIAAKRSKLPQRKAIASLCGGYRGYYSPLRKMLIMGFLVFAIERFSS
ncbi:hypothetical protein L1049_008728 [Liquidambar formosana]|uniref:F-box domain-containing protein n=1 Tax=Liquidambar formosana TaxID=63359 RepID=A0AAP0X8G1_LIQFO